MARTVWQKGIPLDEAAQAYVRKLLKDFGERETARIFDIGVISVVRAAAGCGLRRGTSHIIKMKLSELSSRAQSAPDQHHQPAHDPHREHSPSDVPRPLRCA